MAKRRRIPRIVVVGGGKFGELHLKVLSQLERDGEAELAALVDVNRKTLAERKRQYGMVTFADLGRCLKSVSADAVTIATPDHLHRDLALAAIARGKHVLVEKPLDVTTDGCRQIGAAARRQGVLLQVDFHKRFDPYLRELRRRVGAGDLGEVLYGYAWMEDRIEVPRDWFPAWAPKSSPFWFLGVHMADLFRWAIGRDAVRVAATGSKKMLASLGIDAYDCVNARIEFDGGVSLALDTCWILPDRFEAIVNQGVRVVGTRGLMEVDCQDRGAEACFEKSGQQTFNAGFLLEEKDAQGRPLTRGYGFDSIADFARNVRHLLEGGRLSNLDGRYAGAEDGLQATKIAQGVQLSVDRGGESVDLRPL